MNPYGAAHQTPERIIVHAMAEYLRVDGKIVSAADFLLRIKLSAHVLITPSGRRVRLREDEQGAHHARKFNRNSLGIEFLVPGIHTYDTFLAAIQQPYVTDAAWRAGVVQTREWRELHNIAAIDRHSDVDPDRKKDPGKGFAWLDFLEAVA